MQRKEMGDGDLRIQNALAVSGSKKSNMFQKE
jgi:hypothetical protein